MSKSSVSISRKKVTPVSSTRRTRGPLFAGIDIGASELTLALRLSGETIPAGTFLNDEEGFRAIIKRLKSFHREVFVCMEATGIYFFRVASRLAETEGIEVMVVNPNRVRKYALAMGKRVKTDKVDAGVIARFAENTTFLPWEPPGPVVESIRALSRRIAILTKDKAAEKSRLHAYEASGTSGCGVGRDIMDHIEYLKRMIEKLREELLDLIKSVPEIHRKYKLLRTVPGIGEKTGVAVLAELLYMPDCLTPRQWVAFAGLDPVKSESGTSVRGKPRISRMGNAGLRRALFFPAMVAKKCDGYVKAFALKLTQRSENPLKKIQVIVAVM